MLAVWRSGAAVACTSKRKAKSIDSSSSSSSIIVAVVDGAEIVTCGMPCFFLDTVAALLILRTAFLVLHTLHFVATAT